MVLVYPLMVYLVGLVIIMCAFLFFCFKKRKKESISFMLVLIICIVIFFTTYVNIVKDIILQDTIEVIGEYTDCREDSVYGVKIIVDEQIELYSTSRSITKNERGKQYHIEYYKNSRIIKSMNPLPQS